MLDGLRIAKYRFTLQAGVGGLELPPWKASTFRGGFGHVFKRLTCIHPGETCGKCPAASYCAYTYVFETGPGSENEEAFMGKYDQVPRPFVLETPMDKQTRYEPGEFLTVNVLLFGKAIHYAPLFVSTFKELGAQGVGKSRKPYTLIHVENVHPLSGASKTMYMTGADTVGHQPLVVTGADIISFMKTQGRWNCATLFFETPLRLKSQGSYTDDPRFSVIVRSLLRRVSGILQFHHGSTGEMDYRGMLAKAENVCLVQHSTRWVDYNRYSARQDEHMKLGGIMGWANYEGELAEFLPWLKAAELLHIGKNTVFDLGRIRVVG